VTADVPGLRMARAALAMSRLRRPPIISGAVILLLLLLAAVPQLFTPYSPVAIAPRDSLQPPAFVDGGSLDHPLGTDVNGRDVAARVVYGARAATVIASLVLVLGGGIGISLGMIAGFYGGRLDTVIMRLVDISLAFPTILIVLMAAAVAGSSFWLVVGATSFVIWARFARLIRSEVLSLRERDYIALARVAGRSDLQILRMHILPNAANSIVVLATLQVGWIIIIEGSLSFLGAGIPPPSPTWGNMVASGRSMLETAWWLSVCPALAIALTVFAFNSVGDWLRDELDPRLRNLA
jgi:peptide/nickel transport system permease protein